jgi:hypothetical protein
MTNKLDHLVNIVRIKPFTVSMAAKEDKSTAQCTHRGDFPIPMLTARRSIRQCITMNVHPIPSYCQKHLLCKQGSTETMVIVWLS